MKKITLLVALTIFSFSTSAASLPKGLQISPIIGFEKVFKLTPTPHTKTQMVLGIGVVYGIPLLSAEAELTRATTDENFYSDDISVKEESYALKLGLRSSITLGPILRWYLRAGGQARKIDKEVTTSGVTTHPEVPVYVDPYAGTGLSIRFGRFLYANAGITVVFTGRPKGDDREYQTTLSMGLKI